MHDTSKQTSGQGGKVTYKFVPGAGPRDDTPVEYALAQARLNIATMPVRDGTKRPLLSEAEGGHGWKTCSTDPTTLTGWFSDPEAGVAISPAMCGLILVDIDDRHEGDKVLTMLRRRFGSTMFDTPTHITGNGERLIFAYPPGGLGEYEDFELSLPTTGGFELFGDAPFAKPNYAIAPNATHENGAKYEYPRGASLWDKPARPFPLEVLPPVADYYEQQPKPKKATKAEAPVATEVEQVSEKQLSALREWDRSEWFATEVMRKLVGVPNFQIGRNFHSPLRPETRASCTVIQYARGEYRYKDHGDDDGADNKPYSLAQVYAAVVGGLERPPRSLTPVQFGLWQTRMLIELGEIQPTVVIKLPPIEGAKRVRAWTDLAVPQYVRDVYDAFHLTLVCQAYFHDELRPVPFTYNFAASWAAVTRRQAESAIKWLKRNDYLLRVDYLPKPEKGGRATGLFLPRGYEDYEFSEAALSQDQAPRPNKKSEKKAARDSADPPLTLRGPRAHPAAGR